MMQILHPLLRARSRPTRLSSLTFVSLNKTTLRQLTNASKSSSSSAGSAGGSGATSSSFAGSGASSSSAAVGAAGAGSSSIGMAVLVGSALVGVFISYSLGSSPSSPEYEEHLPLPNIDEDYKKIAPPSPLKHDSFNNNRYDAFHPSTKARILAQQRLKLAESDANGIGNTMGVLELIDRRTIGPNLFLLRLTTTTTTTPSSATVATPTVNELEKKDSINQDIKVRGIEIFATTYEAGPSFPLGLNVNKIYYPIDQNTVGKTAKECYDIVVRTPKFHEDIDSINIPSTALDGHLLQMKKGDTISINAIHDREISTRDVNDINFIVEGNGISPVFQFLENYLSKLPNMKYFILASDKRIEDIVFEGELKYMIKSSNGRAKLLRTLTDNTSDRWAQLEGKVTLDMIKQYVPNYQSQNTRTIVSGSREFVNSVTKLLEELLVDQRNIITLIV